MNGYTKRLFQGTVAFSAFFMGVCLVVHFCFPAVVAPARSVTFNSYTALLSGITENPLSDAFAKTMTLRHFLRATTKGLRSTARRQRAPRWNGFI